jgi:Putative addiction module component
MDITLPLDRMTLAEKLRAMEAIWADLSRNEEQIQSPDWHEGVLRERDDKLKSAGELPVDWETAKTQLRDQLS